jgi:glycosyltransferase involved in cell wall biosynthesis
MGVVIIVGFKSQRNKEINYYKEVNGIDLNEITVLIPFRNEEHRIQVLLDSIKNSKLHPKEFIFIDDHSTDKTVQLIVNELGELNFSVISLPDGITGKKKALRYATENSVSTYILTLDADVKFDSTYFESLSRLEESDFYILPAIMEAKSFKEYFFEIDLILVNATNAALAGLSRPIMASGANLLYKRSIFNEVDNLESHINSASGDDTYLLRDFRENKKDVRLISNRFCSIQTETPQSFREFIDQRLRWIGKTGDIKDNLSTSLAIGQSILTLAFFFLLIYSCIQTQWKILFVLFIVKSAIDLVLFAPYFSRIGRRITWLFIPIYEVLFPIHTLMILTLMLTYKPKWKGREIYKKK